MSVLKFSPAVDNSDDATKKKKKHIIDLGNESEVIHIPKFLPLDESWSWFDYLNKHIPWNRPTIRVFGRSCLQVSLLSSLCLIVDIRVSD